MPLRLLPILIAATLAVTSSPRGALPEGNSRGFVTGAGPVAVRQRAHAPRSSSPLPKAQKGASARLPFRTQPDDALTRLAFEKFYNMDYDGAIELFREERKARPDDPFVVNHLLAAVLAKELNREGQLDATLYMGNRFLQLKVPPVDPRVKAEIGQLSQRALKLANQTLAKNPNDVDALFARSVARGLATVYSAVIEKKWMGALKQALGAYHDDVRILKLDPHYSDAKLVVGTYQYIVGSLSWWEKSVAFVADIRGSKKKGLQLLRQAADGGGEESIDAGTILALFLAREKHYPEAIGIISQSYANFPHNFILGLARADLLNASGQKDEAIAAYRKLVELGRDGFFPDARVERAAYSLGRALQDKKDYAGAARAYEEAVNFPHANVAIAAPAALSAGEMYDLLGRRQAAIECYHRAMQIAPNSDSARTAARLIDHPYRAS
ncbi:MAG TPA: tetratricopeptide repeat protein [Candidatus Acidoferrales bacterium]|nr:tetratricopeptide repeat protein [Candidatus Acidoferrales bacterium]